MELSNGQRLGFIYLKKTRLTDQKGEDEDIPLSRLTPLQLGQLWKIEPGTEEVNGLTRTIKPYTEENIYPTTSTYEKIIAQYVGVVDKK